MSKQKKVLEIFFQNPTYSHLKTAKLSKVAKSSVGDIEEKQGDSNCQKKKRRWKEERLTKSKRIRSSGQLQEIHANPKEISPKSLNPVVSLSEKHSRVRV